MAIGNSITFMVDLAGDRHYIELNPSVLSDNVSSRSNKVVTDTVVDNAFTSFKSNNTIDSITGYASSSKWPTARSTYQMISRMSQGVAGGFLGNLTVAQINALTTHKNGDNAVVTDSGTVNPGSVAVVAGDKISWTTGNVWVKELTNYIRPEDYATTVRGGTVVSTSNTAGSISIDENGHATVNGWDTFAKASLINCDETGLFNLMSVSGNGGWIASSDEEFKVVTYKSNSGQHETLNFSLSAIWNWIKGKLSSEADVNVSGSSASCTGNAASATKSAAVDFIQHNCANDGYTISSSELAKSHIYVVNGNSAPANPVVLYADDMVSQRYLGVHFPLGGTLRLTNDTGSNIYLKTNNGTVTIASSNYYDFVAGKAGTIDIVKNSSTVFLACDSRDANTINGHAIEVVSSGSSVSTTAGTISIVTFN